jgi:hypothetical protein
MEEHVRDEHSTFTWLLEAMFERTGFTIESADNSDDGFDARYLLCATSHSSGTSPSATSWRTSSDAVRHRYREGRSSSRSKE